MVSVLAGANRLDFPLQNSLETSKLHMPTVCLHCSWVCPLTFPKGTNSKMPYFQVHPPTWQHPLRHTQINFSKNGVEPEFNFWAHSSWDIPVSTSSEPGWNLQPLPGRPWWGLGSLGVDLRDRYALTAAVLTCASSRWFLCWSIPDVNFKHYTFPAF